MTLTLKVKRPSTFKIFCFNFYDLNRLEFYIPTWTVHCSSKYLRWDSKLVTLTFKVKLALKL